MLTNTLPPENSPHPLYVTVQDKVQAAFPGVVLEAVFSYDMLTLTVTQDVLVPVFRFLFADAALQFQFLTDLCGVHYPDPAPARLGVVYHLQSLTHNLRLRITSFTTDVETPCFPTMTGVFPAANWMERETYDFYGIVFEGHPNMKRILNMDDMDYFPLRKEYALEDDTRVDKDDRMFGR